MKIRERAIAAINHEEVFPVPIDVFENGIYPKLDNRISSHFGLPLTSQLPPTDRDAVLEALGACCRWARPFYIGPSLTKYRIA